MRRIGVEERRARLGLRHRLALPATTAIEAARGVVALHSSDPNSVLISVHARCPTATVESIEHAIFEERSMIRLLGMRRTMFVVPLELAAAVQHGCVRSVGDKSRRTYLKLLADAGVGDDAWLAGLEEATHAALVARGTATAAELSADVPLLRTQIQLSAGKRYESKQTVTPWVLILLAAQGRIARGRPIGTAASTQWRWSTMDSWLPGGLPELTVDAARAQLARAYLASFGPVTVADLRWWTGWTLGETRKALAVLDPLEVDLGGVTGLILPSDVDAVASPPPWVALLPGLDPTPMGWTQRDWYLGPHSAALYDGNGNVCPTVWCDGRIVGAWAQRPCGEIGYKILEDIGAAAVDQVASAADRLRTFLGTLKVSTRARGRSQIEQDLLDQA